MVNHSCKHVWLISKLNLNYFLTLHFSKCCILIFHKVEVSWVPPNTNSKQLHKHTTLSTFKLVDICDSNMVSFSKRLSKEARWFLDAKQHCAHVPWTWHRPRKILGNAVAKMSLMFSSWGSNFGGDFVLDARAVNVWVRVSGWATRLHPRTSNDNRQAVINWGCQRL